MDKSGGAGRRSAYIPVKIKDDELALDGGHGGKKRKAE
jgi:hypothetical protein